MHHTPQVSFKCSSLYEKIFMSSGWGHPPHICWDADAWNGRCDPAFFKREANKTWSSQLKPVARTTGWCNEPVVFFSIQFADALSSPYCCHHSYSFWRNSFYTQEPSQRRSNSQTYKALLFICAMVSLNAAHAFITQDLFSIIPNVPFYSGQVFLLFYTSIYLPVGCPKYNKRHNKPSIFKACFPSLLHNHNILYDFSSYFTSSSLI